MKLYAIAREDVDIDVPELAEELAKIDSGLQAYFLNSFYKSLLEACGNKEKTESQLSFVANALNENGKELIIALYELLKCES